MLQKSNTTNNYNAPIKI